MKEVLTHKILPALLFGASVLSLNLAYAEEAAAPATKLSLSSGDVERRLNILSEEIEKLRSGEGTGTEPSIKSGLGPAAGKVYSQKKGVSLAGYGEMLYENFAALNDDGSASDKTDQIDLQKEVLYLGYKFSDDLLFNSELEFEHGSTEHGGAVSVEFAYVDYLLNSNLNLRSGMLLVPLGIINEIHEPPTFYSVRKPNVENSIIPATWSANGAGLFGNLSDQIRYALYMTESLKATGNFTSEGIREGRQGGAEALATNFALSGRLDYEWAPGSVTGVSFFNGGTSQGQIAGTNANLLLWDVHGRLKKGPWELRGLYASTSISDVALINAANGYTGNQSVGSSQYGWYAEAAYDVLPLLAKNSEQALVGFVRYEALNTQAAVPAGFSADPANDRRYWVYGLSYLPLPNVTFKIDYQNESKGDNTGNDVWRLATTYMF